MDGRSLSLLLLALLSMLAAVAAGPGYRLGWWTLVTAFVLLSVAVVVAAVALAVALAGFARGGHDAGIWARSLVVLVATPVIALPVYWLWQARCAPPIHDITTDIENPPGFEAILSLRAGAPNPVDYGGPELAALQREFYPDIGPLILPVSPTRAYAAALAVARAQGWEIITADSPSGRIEATDTTFWFGFKDDIAIRITPYADGSRGDMRSVSRVGRSDFGTNARRVRAYLAALSARARPIPD